MRPMIRSVPNFRRAARGFTLIEIMISVAITAILMTALVAAVLAQTNAYELNARTREAVQNGRSGLDYLERKLSQAGYGVDPRRVFDFGTAAVPITRDWADRPDELVFYSRDPAFSRLGSYDSNVITLETNLTSDLLAGQVLQLICPSGSRSAYVTVSSNAARGQNKINIRAPTGNFPNETPTDCLLINSAGSRPYVLKVDRYRFFVADVLDGGEVRPFLLLDQGLDLSGARAFDAGTGRYVEWRDDTPGDGVAAANPDLANVVPVAGPVEDLQVAYLMNEPTPLTAGADSNQNWILGDNALVAQSEQPNPAAAAPRYETAYRDATRRNFHPANIRGVRVNLVTRSARAFGDTRSARPALENRAAGAAQDGFFRNVLKTQVRVHNMLSRSAFAPLRGSETGNLGGS